MLNLNSVMIGTQQPQELAAFYEKVIGKAADMVDGEQGFWGWQVGSAFLGILKHSEMGGSAKDAGRVMFNFETAQVKEEFERITALGATVVAAPYEMDGAGSRPWRTPTATTFS
jgi:predicted enzyme related to lactoylglutathione lyase